MVPTLSSFCTCAEFSRIGLTIAQAVKVELNKKATKPSYKLQLDLGAALIEEHKKLYKKPVYSSSAQLCSNHCIEDLTGQQMLTVINFPRKQIGTSMSDCLTTGVLKESADEQEKRDSTVFVKPSTVVPLGSKVSLLAEKECFQTNPRDIVWTDFLKLDFRIGTLAACDYLKPITEEINQVLFAIELGELGSRTCIARLSLENGMNLIGKQVLVLTNLDPVSKEELFSLEDYKPCGEEVVLCTVDGGKAVLEPGKLVENGLKLA